MNSLSMRMDRAPGRPSGLSNARVFKCYYQQSKDRLFITFYREQAIELRRMCGKRIVFMAALDVEMRRAGEGFAEEITLARSS